MTTETALLARPLPAINDMNGYFWCGGADGVLHIMKCGDCSLYFHPYQSCCSACLSANVAPAPVSGFGKVLSSTINHQPWFPHVPVPYIVALVELDEKGPVRLLTNMFGESVDSIVPGLRVSVHFEQHGDIFVPLFRPV
ncbi:hypothetical protein GCM10011393_30030 [Sphingopyxis bauzanensis]|nr:hypothetical protein GCM10011393_30030 [Sphingopyxis bauzanensis]